jgi:hypothetical protein
MLMAAKWRARDIFDGVVRELHTVSKIKVTFAIYICIHIYVFTYAYVI